MISDMLQCPILYYSIIRYAPAVTLRVKIQKIHLHTTLTASNIQIATVRVWKAKPPPILVRNTDLPSSTPSYKTRTHLHLPYLIIIHSHLW